MRNFVETRSFTARVGDYLDDDAYAELQRQRTLAPDQGVVIPGCGGVRKMRFADAQRASGKRGGVRVIYLHIPEAERIDLLAIYSKREKRDLTPDEKEVLRTLADQARKEAKKRRKN